jgi:hypothetical protein
MGILGGIASGITLWETPSEMQKFGANFNGAPEQWKEYLISLESLAHVGVLAFPSALAVR